MNCYEHPKLTMVAQCPDCGKGLCAECASIYSIPIRKNGNRKRINVEKGEIIKELILMFGVSILLAVPFARWTNGGLSFDLVYNVISHGIPIYVFPRDRPKLKNINKPHSGVFPVSADHWLDNLFYYKTMFVNLCRTCDVASKNGQEYIAVDCLAENKSLIGLNTWTKLNM